MKKHLSIATIALLTLTTAFSQKNTAKPNEKAPKEKVQAGTSRVKYGKYGCTASKYRNGFYEYEPKGSFVINRNGTYAYHGFEKPSTGTYKINQSTGVITFSGGYFNGGEATLMEDRPNRYYVVFPANPDNRWTCGLTAEK